ncbi:MAG: type II toxin-antitoxin system HicB family antitoxin [Desulfobulbaceae bacterium]|nr:type II toxin-antitoxin system HicB family antitoxin [Desulfobulbaceae bacterium]HIJ78794.1 type II toxin-antitoxin system HicB family antitoxin [Deltaproteobacteria bacterium]
MNKLTYKGYTGIIEASIEDGCLHGKILFIEDLITYEGNTVEDINNSFKEAVDHYLNYCEETGKPANKPYSGTFNVRVGQELHRKAVEVAYYRDITLNEFVAQSIKAAIEQQGIIKLEHTHHHNITITDNQTPTTVVATMDQPIAWETLNAIN